MGIQGLLRILTLFLTVRSEGGSECRQIAEAKAAEAISAGTGPSKKRRTNGGDEDWENRSDQGTSRT